jgi:hypothetical protein
MPRFLFLGRDGPRAASLRPVHRPAHLAGIESLDREGRIVHAGPLLGEDGKPRGSAILFEAADLAEARALAARDPYVTEGIFGEYEVFETAVVFPRERGED